MSFALPLALSVLGGTAATAVFIHDFFEGETLLLDIGRTFRLSRMNLQDLDRKARSGTRSDLVVTLTTIPSRIAHLEMTLKSLLDQTMPPAEIRLNIPYLSRREGIEYKIPGWIAALTMVHIVRCEDTGPATKLFPTLQTLAPDTPIVVVDDDRLYPRTFLQDLANAAEANPDAALGLSGWVVPVDFVDRPTTIWSNLNMAPPAPIRARRVRRHAPIDILQGFSGYLVRPRFFPDIEAMLTHAGAPDAAFFVDDVWISGHCAAPKFVIPARRVGFQQWTRKSLYKASSLGLVNRGGAGGDEARNNSIVIRHLADRWTVGGRQLAAPPSQAE